MKRIKRKRNRWKYQVPFMILSILVLWPISYLNHHYYLRFVNYFYTKNQQKALEYLERKWRFDKWWPMRKC